jgi:alginate O-acetyltransferase complex protein AlgI
MNAYTPHDPTTLGLVAAALLATLLTGFGITRLRPVAVARAAAWALAVGGGVGVERLTADEPAGLRMLAIVLELILGMKAVVTVEAQAAGTSPLKPWQWFGFAGLWVGMRPQLFAAAGDPPRAGAARYLLRGLLWSAAGVALLLLCHGLWGSEPARQVALSGLMLVALSVILHFGILTVLAGLWRFAGVDARPLHRAPLQARSLTEFWGRRWNLAFSEMTAQAVYRPLRRVAGEPAAVLASFALSGLLHEAAISVPVRAGYGGPLAYFLLHGCLTLIERAGVRRGLRPPEVWGVWGRVWTLGWLAAPFPILFHAPFVKAVVWPLAGVGVSPDL